MLESEKKSAEQQMNGELLDSPIGKEIQIVLTINSNVNIYICFCKIPVLKSIIFLPRTILRIQVDGVISNFHIDSS